MTATIIDGKAIAADLRETVAVDARRFEAERGRKAGLAVVLVGNDPASEVYVGSKVKLTRAVGMESFEHRLVADTAEADLLALVARLNADEAVDGILVQLPLPGHIDARRVILSIDPAKDVDGLHPENAGRLMNGMDGLVPCTPLGAMILIETVLPSIRGLNAVVLGRSNLVGKPIAQLLLARDATVTMAHSRTVDLPALCRTADILVAAVGRPELVRGDWVKPGATVIDVGINRLAPPFDKLRMRGVEPGTREAEGGRGKAEVGAGDAQGTNVSAKGRLVGDVAFEEARAVAGAVTPVPGGVGPMTIACLLKNTMTAARARNAS